MRPPRLVSLFIVCVAIACAGSDIPNTAPPDSGHPTIDAGTDAGPIVDAGTDAGTIEDAGTDAGTIEDAGTDAGTIEDAGTDAGTIEDAGTDAGTIEDAGTDAGTIEDAGTDGGVTVIDGGTDAGVITLRIMNGNLTSGTQQAYEQPGIDIFAGAHPDIAMVQEFNAGSNSSTDLQSFITAAFGADAHWFRESGSGFQIPNGIVSHYPIIASGSFTDPKVSNRGFAWAEISLPNGKHLWAYSLHLLTSSATNRNDEAVALVADIQAQVPSGDYIAIGGDFNTGTRSEACVTTLSAIVVTGSPYPADNLGNQNTSTNRNEPHDWVIVSSNLDVQETSVVIGSNSFASGLVIDTRVYTPLTDLAPAQFNDSGASGMQHMGVVRDFKLAP